MAEYVQASVVEVDGPDWAGTGFFVSPSCSVVTAQHILRVGDSDAFANEATITLQNGQTVNARVSYEVEIKDFVVLRPTRSITCQELALSQRAPRRGEAVLTVGYPATGSNDELAVAHGNVLSTGVGRAVDFLIFGFATPGSSGSPVVNTDRQVVGMVWGRWALGRDADGNWIHRDYLIAATDVATHLR